MKGREFFLGRGDRVDPGLPPDRGWGARGPGLLKHDGLRSAIASTPTPRPLLTRGRGAMERRSAPTRGRGAMSLIAASQP
jgi:hypothetical protein